MDNSGDAVDQLFIVDLTYLFLFPWKKIEMCARQLQETITFNKMITPESRQAFKIAV